MRVDLIYAIRNIRKNGVNSIITAVGLSVAIAVSLVLYLFISQQYKINDFHANGEKLYRLNYSVKYIDFFNQDVRVEPDLVDKLKENFPQIEKSCEYRSAFEQQLRFGMRYFDTDMAYASHDFFDMFTFPLIVGGGEKLFEAPYEIILTQSMAEKLSPGIEDYSELLEQGIEFPVAYGKRVFTIVGVMEDLPKNSSIHFEAIVSGKSGRNFGGCDNYFGYTSVYYQLYDNANPTVVEESVVAYLKDYYQDRVERMQGDNQLIVGPTAFEPFILPLKEVYLSGRISNCFERKTDKNRFFILIAISALILLIACSNYTLLSLGQYLKRIGDIGIRKAMGAKPINIFALFFSEGLILTITALILGGMLCVLIIPAFEDLTDQELFVSTINIPRIVGFVVLLVLSIVVLSSIIPVVVFSKVSPHQVAGNKLNIGNKNRLSQIFVSVQYSISIILIILTFFIVRQSNHMKNQPLGFETKNVLDIHIFKLENDNKILLKERLSRHPGVMSLTLTSRDFMNGSSNNYINKGNGQQINVWRFKVDEDYIPTIGLKLIDGKNFTKEDVRIGSHSAIVNQSFVEAYEVQDDPIGASFRFFGGSYRIVGVVEDYHYFGLRNKIQPAALLARTDMGNPYMNLMVKFDPDQIKDFMAYLQETYEEVAPGKTLDYEFWDEVIGQRYEVEEIWSSIIGFSSAIAIIISTLGLFGLTILLINQRFKEIGIRKVNGARPWEIQSMIAKSFVGWLIGSLIIAIPVSYYIVTKWLALFAYKVDVSWWLFVIAGALALVVALLTVSYHSWRAARKNPVEALRYE